MNQTQFVSDFVFQYKPEEVEDFIDTIRVLSTNYFVRKSNNDDSLILIQTNKLLPFYGDHIRIDKGDYLIPQLASDKTITFNIVSESKFKILYSDRT